ncbi:Putative F-box protein PP2-B8 [Linum grandiflorum]
MDKLPEECVEKVMSYLGPRQICSLAVLSKTLWSASQSEQLWQSFLPACYEPVISRSSSSDFERLQGISTRQLYRQLCQRPTLIDQGTKSWKMDVRTGKVTMMVMKPNGLETSRHTSIRIKNRGRFDVLRTLFKVRETIRTQRVLLSPNTFYAAYLVLKLENSRFGLDPDRDPPCITINVRRRVDGRDEEGKFGYSDEQKFELGFNMGRQECEAKLDEFWTKEVDEKEEEVTTSVTCKSSSDDGDLTFCGVELRPNSYKLRRRHVACAPDRSVSKRIRVLFYR